MYVSYALLHPFWFVAFGVYQNNIECGKTRVKLEKEAHILRSHISWCNKRIVYNFCFDSQYLAATKSWKIKWPPTSVPLQTIRESVFFWVCCSCVSLHKLIISDSKLACHSALKYLKPWVTRTAGGRKWTSGVSSLKPWSHCHQLNLLGLHQACDELRVNYWYVALKRELLLPLQLLPDVLKKVWTEIEQCLEGCYVTVLSILNHIGHCK